MDEKIIVVKGKFPFVLMLEDSINDDWTPDFSKAIQIRENSGEVIVELYCKKRINKNQQGITIAIEDIYGDYTFSDFLVVYSEHNTKVKSLRKLFYKNDKLDSYKIASYTTGILNKFIEIYKTSYKHKKDWIPFLTHSLLSPWSISVLNSKSERIDGIQTLDIRGTGEGLGNVVSKEQLSFIKNHSLESNIRLTPATRFLQEANRYNIVGDSVSSIIYMAFYIEKWIFSEVRYELQLRNNSVDEIEKLLVRKSGRYIDRYEAVRLILQNRNFKNSIQFKEYDKNVVMLRDEIVHRDRSYASKEETNLAMTSTMNFRDFLLNEFNKKNLLLTRAE